MGGLTEGFTHKEFSNLECIFLPKREELILVQNRKRMILRRKIKEVLLYLDPMSGDVKQSENFCSAITFLTEQDLRITKPRLLSRLKTNLSIMLDPWNKELRFRL